MRVSYGALIGAVCAVAVGILSFFDPTLFGLEWLLYDPLSRRAAAASRPDPRIVIVNLSEKAVRTLEADYGRPTSYSRELMARVAEEVRRGGGRVVVFDWLFTGENFADPEGDRRLAAALRETPAVLGAQTEAGRSGTPVSPAFRRHVWTIARPPSQLPLHRLVTPDPAFGTAAAIGTLRLPIEERSSRTRRYITCDQVSPGGCIPSLAVAAVAEYLGIRDRKFVFDGNGNELTLASRLRIPVARDGRFLIRWSGRKERERELHYESIDFDKVIVASLARQEADAPYAPQQLDEFARRSFAGKIVIVGATAAGLFDLRATPLSSTAAGVEIHANAIDNLLNRIFLREANRWSVVLLIVLVTAGLGAACARIDSQIAAAALALGTLLAWGGAELIVLHRGWFLPAASAILATIATYVAVTVTSYVAEQRRSRRLQATFGSYVSPQILDYLLANPDKVELGGERREMTILFSDIRGFTSISEASEPEEVVEMLNEYLTRMVEILLRHGGTLDKFIGDAVMGFWNAPAADPEHAEDAVRCAIEMVEETARLRSEWQSEGKAALRIGIGINTGEAVVGNIGSRQVFGYTVIGDAVNLASRLEGKNKDYGTEIIISESTLERIGSGIVTSYLDEVKVKGKEKAVRIYEVKGATQ